MAVDMSEIDRVKAVQALQIIGSAAEPEFDRLARLAGHVAHADYAHLCFIDDVNSFSKAMSGLSLPQYTSRHDTICVDTVDSDVPILIEDLAADPRPKCQSAHRLYGFSSYVGVPIHSSDGFVVGAVAVLSFEKGLLSQRRLAALRECAGLVTRELLIRKAASEEVRRGAIPVARQAAATPDIVRAIARNHLDVLRSVSDGVIVVRGDGVISLVNSAAEQMLGRSAASMLGSTFAKKLNVSMMGVALSEKECPVAASLRDGNERLAKRGYFLGGEGNAVKVEYAVSLVSSTVLTVGAVVVFRRIMNLAPSNGVALRDTIREVYRLKEQIGRLEAARAKAKASTDVDVLDLRPGQSFEFEDLIEAIRDEHSSQNRRAQALGGARIDGSAEPSSLLGTRSDLLGPGDVKGRSPSRVERWLES